MLEDFLVKEKKIDKKNIVFLNFEDLQIREDFEKNPKEYFVGLGLRNYCLNNFGDIKNRTDRGELAENFVFGELGFLKEKNFNLNFWRTTSKAKVDFIVSCGETIVPVEVKFKNMDSDTVGKSFFSFLEKYNPDRGIIATKDFWGERKIKNTLIKFIPIGYI